MLDLQNGIDTSRKNRRGWEGAAPASDAVARASVPRLSFFFFFFFPQIRAELASIRAESGWFGQNRAVSAISNRIGRRPIQPKQAENGRNRPWNSPETAKILTSKVFLAFLFLCFVNQGIVMCFLRIF